MADNTDEDIYSFSFMQIILRRFHVVRSFRTKHVLITTTAGIEEELVRREWGGSRRYRFPPLNARSSHYSTMQS